MKVLIISGGTDSERKLSLISSSAVRKALEKSGFEVEIFDFKKGYPRLKDMLSKFDVFFPVMHGEQGEGGKLQKVLFQQKVKFVGGGWRGLKEGWYKVSFKKFCDRNNIRTAAWTKVKTKKEITNFGFPCVFKISSGGSSREVAILKSIADLIKVKKFLNKGVEAYVEKYLPGTEVTVGILNNKPLPVLEIIPPQGKWFNYKNKYSGKTKEIPFAPSVSVKLQKNIQKIARTIHKKLNLGQYSRIDFIISDGKAFVLEVNTIPGLTSESLFPRAAKAAGISFTELIKILVGDCFQKRFL